MESPAAASSDSCAVKVTVTLTLILIPMKTFSWRAATDADLGRHHEKAMEDAAKESEDQLRQIAVKEHWIGFNVYFLICFVAAFLPCLVTILVWSDMGSGKESMDFLAENEVVAYLCAGYVAVMLISLYLLDFFVPPHLPGHYFTLSKRDPIIGILLMAQVTIGAAGAGLFFSKDVPYLPVLVTVVHGPLFMAVIREATRPNFPAQQIRGSRIKASTTADALKMLANMLSDDIDSRNYYGGAMTAFVISGFLTVFIWILWALSADVDLTGMKLGNSVEERKYIRWLAPLIGGVANITFGLIAALRIMLAKDYQDTDDLRVDLICKVDEVKDPEELDTREMVVASLLKEQGTFEVFTQLDEKDQKAFAREEIHIMSALFKTMKVIGCSFLCLLGGVYVAAELVAADSDVARMLLALVGVIFVCFVAFLFASFGRLMATTKDWFLKCPIGRMAVGLSRSDWARAAMFCLVLPAVPPLLLLSALNQFVRRCRGLYSRITPRGFEPFQQQAPDAPSGANGVRQSCCTVDATSIEVHASAQDQIFTERFMEHLDAIRRWNWISIIPKVSIVAMLYVCYVLCPKLINVLLAWLSALLRDGVPFAATVVLTVLAGITCFLLPPVPGLPVYLFAGAIIASTCPMGFWPGCAISVSMGLVLKLTACAIQQKLIGEALGSSVWIKSQVGVNKPFFRAVERILTKPGLSLGKVAILCGGPDWPTSVLCGLLRCSLLQMELGTLPIIVFITPCTLYGSLYTRQTESEVWKSLTNVMLLLSIMTNMAFGIGAAWAVQEELDAYNWEVTKPLHKYIDLDWLDYRSAQIAQSCVIEWRDVPCFLRTFALLCALVEVGVCHFLYFMPKACFGTFNITDPMSKLKWYGEDALFKLPGVIALAVAFVGLTGFFCLTLFLQKKRAKPYAAKAERLDASEAAWKEERAWLAMKANSMAARSASELLRTSQRLSQASKTSTGMRIKSEPKMTVPIRRIDKE